MANRRPQQGGRRSDFGRNDRVKNFDRSGVSPWQTSGPGGGLPNLLPLAGGTEATLALASNIINLLQPRQNPVPSLLDMPIRRDFIPEMGRFDRSFGNRMNNQGNFRRSGNYNRAGERINTNRKPFRPNDGYRHNKSSPKKEADSKAKPVKESEDQKTGDDDKTEIKEEKKEVVKTRYDDINPQLLKCHICNKSMWDGRSFENHLSGRAHAIMMQKTAESYALTADTMRQEIKIRDMKYTRKSGQQPNRDFYCAMCDMYAADGAVHRTTTSHRKLKKYLHPSCVSCHKEMPTRIELDEHRLTAEHLKNIQDKQEDLSNRPSNEVMVISTLAKEQLYLRENRERRPRKKIKDQSETKTTEDGIKTEEDNGEVTEDTKQQTGEEKQDGENTQKPVESVDKENTILDYKEGDDLNSVTSDMFPTYSTERGVGRSFLSEFRCIQCKLCNKLLDTEETAEVHLRTWRHHQFFVRLIAQKSGNQAVQESTKRPMNSEETGNWKRRKTTTENEDDQNEDDKDDEPNGDVTVKDEVQNGEEQNFTDEILDRVEDLEDWEKEDGKTVDEILEDEKKTADVDVKIEPEDEKESEPEVKEKLQEVTESPKAKTPPRGRGRGRRRY